MSTQITVETTVRAPLEKVWACWTEPEHIIHWNFADDSWQCPSSENDVRVGGKFKSRMEAKDGSAQFDFEGVYTEVEEMKHLQYDIGGRIVKIDFITEGDSIRVVETFDAEDEISVEMQKAGWQSILNNFKKHVESE